MGIQRNMADTIQMFKASRGKSLNEFAFEIEIARSTLQDYMSGNGNPTLAMVEHIAEKLGVDASFLVTGAFSPSQAEILSKILEGVEYLTSLSPSQREELTKTILNMMSILDGSDHNE